MQPAGRCHGVADRSAWETAHQGWHARGLSQAKDADGVPATGGKGLERCCAPILGHR